MSADQSNFGPSAILTPANLLTLGRIAAAPVVVVLFLHPGPSWILVGLWFVVSVSDGIDGWVARKMGATRSGAFLDPLADKVAVLAAFSVLVYQSRISWIPVAIVALREIAMSFYRSYAARRGVSIPARKTAKAKTFVQDSAIGLACLPVLVHHNIVIVVALWLAVALTVFTGVQYLLDGKKVMDLRVK